MPNPWLYCTSLLTSVHTAYNVTQFGLGTADATNKYILRPRDANRDPADTCHPPKCKFNAKCNTVTDAAAIIKTVRYTLWWTLAASQWEDKVGGRLGSELNMRYRYWQGWWENINTTHTQKPFNHLWQPTLVWKFTLEHATNAQRGRCAALLFL